MPKGINIDWKPEYIKFIHENYKNMSMKELTIALNERFGTEIPYSSVKGYKCRNRLVSGRDTRFKKGHVPKNKGKKISPEHYAKTSKTMFKKGCKSYNIRPVGSERIDPKTGYVKVKIAQPNVWKFKHRYVWEQYYGEIPKDHLIKFKDSNRSNCDIENLMLVKKSIHRYMCTEGYSNLSEEHMETAVLLCECIIQTKKLKKEGNKK